MPLWDDFLALCVSLFSQAGAFFKSAFTTSGLPVKQVFAILVITALIFSTAKALLYLLKNTIDILQKLIEISLMLLKLMSVVVAAVILIAVIKTLFVAPNSDCKLVREIPFIVCTPRAEMPPSVTTTPDNKIPATTTKPTDKNTKAPEKATLSNPTANNSKSTTNK